MMSDPRGDKLPGTVPDTQPNDAEIVPPDVGGAIKLLENVAASVARPHPREKRPSVWGGYVVHFQAKGIK